jgi:hypothetical protein
MNNTRQCANLAIFDKFNVKCVNIAIFDAVTRGDG